MKQDHNIPKSYELLATVKDYAEANGWSKQLMEGLDRQLIRWSTPVFPPEDENWFDYALGTPVCIAANLQKTGGYAWKRGAIGLHKFVQDGSVGADNHRETFFHEVAHILTWRTTLSMFHDRRWQRVMWDFDCPDARCHDYLTGLRSAQRVKSNAALDKFIN